MIYQKLQHRYGSHVSQRVRSELTDVELRKIDIDCLPDWLVGRAEIAHEEYRRLQNNPLASSEVDKARTGEACRRWRAAEDLAYLVAVAKDVGITAQAS